MNRLRIIVATTLAYTLAPLLLLGVLLFAPFALIGMAWEICTGKDKPSGWWNSGVHQGRYKRDA